MFLKIPWNDWYHCIGHTFGSWLPGDPRGWRTRHHRHHVEGDYKNPPTQTSAGLHAQSRKLMTREPVAFSKESQQVACTEIVASLQRHDIEVLTASLDDHHLHVLARFPDHKPRHWLGVAKKDSARALSDAGLIAQGGVWAKRARAEPIADRKHQVKTVNYILDHQLRGAFVWALPAILKQIDRS